MRIGVLTSSRADFGIYLPLLGKIRNDPFFQLEIIAFGTHLSHFHGYTLKNIIDAGFVVQHKIESLVLGDTEEAISSSIGLTALKFSSFWKDHQYFDWVLCLGDRFEMFGAVVSGIPYNINFAHFHGGEVTLGAIDNVFRHSITQASKLHFTSTEASAERISMMLDSAANVFNVGSLSLDNLIELNLFSESEFFEKWGIDLKRPTILVTFHPETVNPNDNKRHAEELSYALRELGKKYQIVITMPNADTSGNVIRKEFEEQLKDYFSTYLIENFGTKGYFTLMSKCSFLLGNTSSGIIEAASFNKRVINLGDRQKGRQCSENIIQTPVNRSAILASVRLIESLPPFDGKNIYWDGNASMKVIKILKDLI